ncbi:MAG: AEC family transporter [Clostridia bacterium]|nr:AEC family transporter [Clostridia bacterium]
MEQAKIVLTQMLILFGTMLVGYLALRTGFLPASLKDALPEYVTRLAMPAAILASILKVDRALLASSGIVVAACLAGLVVNLLLGRLTAAAFRLKGDRVNTHLMCNMFSNTTFLGLPLLTALVPEGVFCIPIYSLTCNVVLYTVGVGLYTARDRAPAKSGGAGLVKRLLNPVTATTLLGLALVLLNIRLPDLVLRIVDSIGSTSSPLSMIYIGAILTDMDIAAALRRTSILLSSPLRLVLMPLAAFLVLRAAGVSPLVTETLTILFALPCQVSISMLARTGGSDYVYVTEYVLLSTLLSILTIPLVTTLMALL